jgi:hypothetical protein
MKYQRVETQIGIPVYVFLQDMTPEEIAKEITDPIWLGVTKEGTIRGVHNDTYSSVATTGKLDLLGAVKPFAQVSAARMPVSIPGKMFTHIDRLFAAVFADCRSEVAILLLYNFETKKWCWSLPHQTVAPASADYSEAKGVIYILDDGKRQEELPDGFVKFGSIHSHASMAAFHSGTDDHDEFNFDGVHITLGNYNSNRSYSQRWIFNGQSFKIKAINDIAEVPDEVLGKNSYPDIQPIPVTSTHRGGSTRSGNRVTMVGGGTTGGSQKKGRVEIRTLIKTAAQLGLTIQKKTISSEKPKPASAN